MRKTMKILGIAIALIMVATTFVNTVVSEGGDDWVFTDRNDDGRADLITIYRVSGNVYSKTYDNNYDGWSDEMVVDYTGDGVGDSKVIDTNGDHIYDVWYTLIGGTWTFQDFVSIPCTSMPDMPKESKGPGLE